MLGSTLDLSNKQFLNICLNPPSVKLVLLIMTVVNISLVPSIQISPIGAAPILISIIKALDSFMEVTMNLSKQRVYLSVRTYAICNEYKRIVAL